VNSYISGSTVQRVQGADVKNYSKFLANLLLGQQFYEIKRIKFGFVVIPSSCKSDTAVYEYVMKHRETGRKAVAQVKQGAVNLDLNKYVGIDADIFLFTSGGSYIGANKPNIFCLKSDELVSFANENYHLMSDRITFSQLI
jgi:hypothetical protein